MNSNAKKMKDALDAVLPIPLPTNLEELDEFEKKQKAQGIVEDLSQARKLFEYLEDNKGSK